ncbi:Thyrotropin-releasing hormone receptor [Frankliniella fusca]|uniref:Thyrotropin-releasing hormone receptor n=1 Tax=Frankliniella fusca TaxID=407009 RepID=A0AAE1HC71_9NEOP|nr:Thyrotropin-releasing hormone receptor [Frankliniella fusca]
MGPPPPFFDVRPILAIAEYRFEEYWDGSLVPVCVTPADTFWKAAFFIGTISLFFGIPLVLLVALYSVIARHLMVYPGIMAANQQSNQQPITPNAIKYRKQVVMMLGTVVLSFFICLLPFRAFTLWIIVVPPEDVMALGAAGYYNLLFFCRIMLYLNSAINPILYNLMSSKFRDGFMRLCGVRRCKKSLGRKGTFNTTTSTTTCSSNNRQDSVIYEIACRMSPEGFWRRSLTRGSLGGDSLRGVLQRKASTTSSDSASGPSERVPQHSVVAVRRIDSTLPPALPPQLNGVHRPLMEDVLEDVLEDEAQRVLDESFV